MKKAMMLAYLKETGQKVYDGDALSEPETRGEFVQVEERSKCGNYAQLHDIELIDLLAWIWSGGGVS
jgi:hypothetical protein